MSNNVIYVCEDTRTKYELLWESKNGRWQIVRMYGPNVVHGSVLQVVDNHTCWVDNPIMYDNGVVAYDNPYRIPKYVQQRVPKLLKEHNKKYRALR